MPPVHFKLTKDGHTRRVTFQGLPSWTELAERLQTLWDIPAEKVGVSYVDNDNDEITASSEEELQDYYQGSHQPGSAVKLTVWDLSVPRGSPAVDAPSTNRNTFGQDNFEFVEPGGWQGLGAFPLGSFLDNIPGSEGPHAFVEIINSDVSGFGSAKEVQDDITNNESIDGTSTVQQPSFSGKGKERSRALSFGAASTTSLVAEEASEKYSIHVIDHNSGRRPQSQFSDGAEKAEKSEQAPMQSTPKAAVQDIRQPEASAVESNTKATAESVEDHADPPLPSMNSATAPSTSATLSNDVATLLTTFTNIVSTHPELSEGIRNIINNARSGVYWQAHRSALSEAVNEISRSEDVRRVEEEAARRINDALGSIFRSFSVGPGNVNSDTNVNATDSTSANAREFTGRHGQYQGPHHLWGRRSTTALDAHRPWSAHWNMPPWAFNGVYPSRGPPPPRRDSSRDVPPFSTAPPHSASPPPPTTPCLMSPLGSPPVPPPPQEPTLSTSAAPPPPPPPDVNLPPPMQVFLPGGDHPSQSAHSIPPPPPLPHGSPRHHGPNFHSYHGPPFGGYYPPIPLPFHVPPPPPPVIHGPPPPPLVHPLQGPPPPRGAPPSAGAPARPPPSNGPPPPGRRPPPPPPGTSQPSGPGATSASRLYANPFFAPAADPIQTRSAEPLSEQELRDHVEEAKRVYKAQKETYRQYRDERKKEKESRRAKEDQTKANVTSSLAAGGTSGETTQIISTGRNGYPPLEIYSVPLPGPGPRRFNTHPGHGSSSRGGGERKTEDLNTRAQSRIAKRLADMGFSENTYPDLPAKIKAQMPATGAITKEGEDDAVTTLLEELLARSTRSPVASGSNRGGRWY